MRKVLHHYTKLGLTQKVGRALDLPQKEVWWMLRQLGAIPKTGAPPKFARNVDAAVVAFMKDPSLSIQSAAINNFTNHRTLRRHLIKRGLPYTIALKKECAREKTLAGLA